MNILVTGGAGYVGSSLIEKLDLLPEITDIYVLDNLSHSPLSFFVGIEKLYKVKFIKGDILDGYILDQLIEKVDVVFHLAGYVSSPYNYAQNVLYEQINQWGTLNLVRSIQQSSFKIKQFIYLSSASVYGLHGKVNSKEEPQPTNAYGKSKLAGEKFSLLLQDHCSVNIVRAANVFGFNSSFRVDSVLNNFIFHGIVDKKILIYGNGLQQRPFISLDQVVKDLTGNLWAIEKNPLIKNSLQFNASLIELKDWLVKNHIPDLEYTFVNRNINYDGQFIEGIDRLDSMKQDLNNTFINFKANLRIGI